MINNLITVTWYCGENEHLPSIFTVCLLFLSRIEAFSPIVFLFLLQSFRPMRLYNTVKQNTGKKKKMLETQTIMVKSPDLMAYSVALHSFVSHEFVPFSCSTPTSTNTGPALKKDTIQRTKMTPRTRPLVTSTFALRGKQIAKYLSTLRAVMFRIVEYVQHSLTNWKSLQSTLPKFQGRYLQILYKSRGMQRKISKSEKAMLDRYKLVVVRMSLYLVTTKIVMRFPVTPTKKKSAQVTVTPVSTGTGKMLAGCSNPQYVAFSSQLQLKEQLDRFVQVGMLRDHGASRFSCERELGEDSLPTDSPSCCAQGCPTFTIELTQPVPQDANYDSFWRSDLPNYGLKSPKCLQNNQYNTPSKNVLLHVYCFKNVF